MKIIDLSLKFGYDSPESFIKIFIRFNDFPSNVARRAGMELKSLNRHLIKIKQEDGIGMDYRIERKVTFTLIAKVSRFHNESIKEEGNMQISDFSRESRDCGVFYMLKNMQETIFLWRSRFSFKSKHTF